MMSKIKLLFPFFFLLLVGCKQQELLKGLDQIQSNEIISLLQRNNIEASKHEVAKEGYSISVGRQDFPVAVELLTLYDLPSKPRLQIADMFPSDALISSPRAEKARLYSGIEQRLEQSLRTLQHVVLARVHVSYDLSASENGKNKTPVHLSALVTCDTDGSDVQLMISDVKRFLKNSFTDVEYDNISVVLSKITPLQHQTPLAARQGIAPSIWLLIVLIVNVSAVGLVGWWWTKKKRSEAAPDNHKIAGEGVDQP
ncbi:EscJ/YscJ/HrcJ family type III secretion inner membrane ring protein [Serratia quinivorans]|uniref:EscJ/YscJ/HrcJ family type III secretion inner membrane ring protein n=1 Tax=Serratia quinivorans TaxID=137545 RepID=UPI003981A4B8